MKRRRNCVNRFIYWILRPDGSIPLGNIDIDLSMLSITVNQLKDEIYTNMGCVATAASQ